MHRQQLMAYSPLLRGPCSAADRQRDTPWLEATRRRLLPRQSLEDDVARREAVPLLPSMTTMSVIELT